MKFDEKPFLLQIYLSGSNDTWYFYLQGEKNSFDNYTTTIKVRRSLKTECYSVVYNGAVCPITLKGAKQIDASGRGLVVRMSAMENIFDIEEDVDIDTLGRKYRFWLQVEIQKIDN